MFSVHGLHFKNLRGDIYGGLTVAIVALPMAMAMGVTSGAGPIAGLYGAIFVGFFAALFGGTPTQISGPTGPMTVVMAVILTQYTSLYPENPEQGAVIAFTVVILGGGFQVIFGLLKFGRFISFIPRPVISGFMSGIGIIIIILQLQTILGHPAQASPLVAIQKLPMALAEPQAIAITLAIISIAIVYLLPKAISKWLPPAIIALVGGSLGLYIYADGDVSTRITDMGTQYSMASAAIIGDIPSGLPQFIMPYISLDLAVDMIKSALILAALGAIDSLLTSLVADNQTRSYHRSNRELIGQGIGNMASGFVGGLPGAGATMSTVVNIRAGGRTPISGVIHALLLLVMVLGLGALAEFIPLAVLAGILIKAGTDIIDWQYLRQLHKVPRIGVFLMLTVLLLTVFVDLISAVAVGMTLAAFILMKRLTNEQINSMYIMTGTKKEVALNISEQTLLEQAEGKILVYQLKGPRSFTSARNMVYRLSQYHGFEAVIFDLSDTTAIDFSTCQAMADIVEGLYSDHHHAYFVGGTVPVLKAMKKLNVLKILLKDWHFKDRYEAIQFASSQLAVRN